MAFKILWFIPLLSWWEAKKRGDRAHLIGEALLIAGTFAQLLVASDTSRLVAAAFPCLIVGAWELLPRDANRERQLWQLVALAFLVPTYYVGQERAVPLMPLPFTLLIERFYGGVWQLWWV